MKRSNTNTKDIRSRIKHSNVHLGTGVEVERVSHSQIQQQRTASGSAGHSIPAASPYQYDSPAADRASYGFPSGQHDASQQQQPQYHQPSQHQHLGVGPSSISLTPSDSISNFEGRQAHMQHRHAHTASSSSQQQYQPLNPSSLSAAHSRQASGNGLFPRPASPTTTRR